MAEEARRAGPGLYLDLPLGVHAHGYDVWREREAFAVEASGGSPPDVVFTKGQDWGFPPLHPERIRAQGYRYVLAYLRRQLACAGVLRIDHMPVFHRLFWIPHGVPASQGVYVRYPAEEYYAIFSLESHRHKAMLVGEDLGTVPPEVPESMGRHNVHRMYVKRSARAISRSASRRTSFLSPVLRLSSLLAQARAEDGQRTALQRILVPASVRRCLRVRLRRVEQILPIGVARERG